MHEESGAVCTAGIVSHKDVTRISPESDSHNLSGPPLASSLYDLKLNECSYLDALNAFAQLHYIHYISQTLNGT